MTDSKKDGATLEVVGRVKAPGPVSVPAGASPRKVVAELAGGLKKGRTLKTVQVGEGRAGCLAGPELDQPLPAPCSGRMVVLDDRSCAVDFAYYVTRGLVLDSKGACQACREGLWQLELTLQRVVEGEGKPEDLGRLETLGRSVAEKSTCELGKHAAEPLLTTLKHFRAEYEEHVKGRCGAGVCKALTTFVVDAATCTGCTKCAKVCPTGAAHGEPKQKHVIDQPACTKCGACFVECPVAAIKVS